MTLAHNYTFSGYDPADGLPPGEWVINHRTRILEWQPTEQFTGEN